MLRLGQFSTIDNMKAGAMLHPYDPLINNGHAFTGCRVQLIDTGGDRVTSVQQLTTLSDPTSSSQIEIVDFVLGSLAAP